jgi:LPXTG-site transpeptidase (sortase) family protein
MKKRLILIITGLILMAVGLTLGLPPLLRASQDSSVPKVAVSPFTQQNTQPTPVAETAQAFQRVEGVPVRLQIPSLGIDLPIIKGYHNKQSNTWTLTKTKVQYAVDTPLANNEGGNTFLYGHNRKEVFRDLSKIALGAEAVVTTENGHVFTYAFEGALETTPDDGTLFNYQGPPIMTVQTCSGMWYQNRQLFTFSLKEAQ